MIRHTIIGALAALALIVAAAIPAMAATAIGSVSRAKGPCEGLSEGNRRSLGAGADIHLDEEVSTGADARLELTFDDGTVLTLGARAKVVIDRFVYQPDTAGNVFRARTVGAFRFVTGKLGKAPASTVQVLTPAATLGIRGTDFWGGPIDGQYGVFLVEGTVSVVSGGRETILSRPGEGMNIIPSPPPLRGGAATTPPISGPITNWSQDKVERALAAVAFN